MRCDLVIYSLYAKLIVVFHYYFRYSIVRLIYDLNQIAPPKPCSLPRAVPKFTSNWKRLSDCECYSWLWRETVCKVEYKPKSKPIPGQLVLSKLAPWRTRPIENLPGGMNDRLPPVNKRCQLCSTVPTTNGWENSTVLNGTFCSTYE
jgi:hypothetical protein